MTGHRRFQTTFLRASFIFTAIVASNAIFGAQAPPPALTVNYDGSRLSASNATPGGEVVFFGEQIEAHTFDAAFFHGVQLATATSDGNADFIVQRQKPSDYVWVAVDVTTGASAVATPRDTRARARSLPVDALRHDGAGNILKARLPILVGDVLLVRPGGGAWFTTVFDGGSSDDDARQDGATTIAFESLASMKKNDKPPHALKKDDVLITMHPRLLSYTVLQVKP